MKTAASDTPDSDPWQEAATEPWVLRTPVVFIVFNRPDTTERVFREIARARPPKLLVIADGPRTDRAGEAERCAATRAIASRVDWPCEVHTNFAETNMGCRRRVVSGLDWAFGLIEEAIILEDDCLPTPGFFQFCDELLARYRDDRRVAQIAGVNFQDGIRRTGASYYFSRYPHIWGWATWRRAWELFDDDMRGWPERRDRRWLHELLDNAAEAQFWRDLFDRTVQGDLDAWSYPWVFAAWANDMLSIVPESNLVSNIGFGSEATHTVGAGSQSEMSTVEMEFPLRHPESVARSSQADAYTDRTIFTRSPVHRLVRWLKAFRRKGQR